MHLDLSKVAHVFGVGGGGGGGDGGPLHPGVRRRGEVKVGDGAEKAFIAVALS